MQRKQGTRRNFVKQGNSPSLNTLDRSQPKKGKRTVGQQKAPGKKGRKKWAPKGMLTSKTKGKRKPGVRDLNFTTSLASRKKTKRSNEVASAARLPGERNEVQKGKSRNLKDGGRSTGRTRSMIWLSLSRGSLPFRGDRHAGPANQRRKIGGSAREKGLQRSEKTKGTPAKTEVTLTPK